MGEAFFADPGCGKKPITLTGTPTLAWSWCQPDRNGIVDARGTAAVLRAFPAVELPGSIRWLYPSG
jgi:hypothetical protein